MDLDKLQQKLIAAARMDRPSDRVPYAFEQRIMARLRAVPALDDGWALWSRALWRAAAPCIAVMLFLSAWSWFAPGGSNSTDLSQEIENTLLAAVDQDQPADSSW
jgi:hypothetical protein